MYDKSQAQDEASLTGVLQRQKKQDYYVTWKKSGLSKVAFCKMHSIPISSFYSWSCKVDRQEKTIPSSFVPIIAKAPMLDAVTPYSPVQLEIALTNQVSLKMALGEDRLVSFIQELMNAIAIVR